MSDSSLKVGVVAVAVATIAHLVILFAFEKRFLAYQQYYTHEGLIGVTALGGLLTLLTPIQICSHKQCKTLLKITITLLGCIAVLASAGLTFAQVYNVHAGMSRLSKYLNISLSDLDKKVWYIIALCIVAGSGHVINTWIACCNSNRTQQRSQASVHLHQNRVVIATPQQQQQQQPAYPASPPHPVTHPPATYPPATYPPSPPPSNPQYPQLPAYPPQQGYPPPYSPQHGKY